MCISIWLCVCVHVCTYVYKRVQAIFPIPIKIFSRFFLMGTGVLPTCIYMQYLWSITKGVGSLGSEIIAGYKLPCGCWEMNWCPREEQPVPKSFCSEVQIDFNWMRRQRENAWIRVLWRLSFLGFYQIGTVWESRACWGDVIVHAHRGSAHLQLREGESWMWCSVSSYAGHGNDTSSNQEEEPGDAAIRSNPPTSQQSLTTNTLQMCISNCVWPCVFIPFRVIGKENPWLSVRGFNADELKSAYCTTGFMLLCPFHLLPGWWATFLHSVACFSFHFPLALAHGML